MTKRKKTNSDAFGKTGKSDRNTLSLYFQEINRIPLLKKEEEEEIAKLAVNGDKAAKEKLVNANLRFVVMVAKKYQGKGLSLEDLIGEGNIGLLNAIKSFDTEKGYRFITYAVWWIRQSIIKAIHEKGRMIRLPSNRAKEVSKVERTRQEIMNEPGWGQENEVQEIARFLNISPERTKDIIRIGHDVSSLDDPVKSFDNALTIKDIIEDVHYCNKSPEERALDNILRQEVEEALGDLEEREATVIRKRFGLGDEDSLTLKEIGAKCNLSRERVRQIEKRALKHLQHSSYSKKFKSYIA